MYVIIDRKGRRTVMPRSTVGDAIDQIAKAVAGRKASTEEKLQAWDRLRDQQGYSVQWVPKLSGDTTN